MIRRAEKLYYKYSNDYYKTQSRIAKQEKFNLVTADKCTYYRSKIEDFRNELSKLYDLLNRILGWSNGESPLPIRSNDLQLANEFSEYFVLKVEGIGDMFENVPLSKSQLTPYFINSPVFNYAKMDQEEILCIIRTVNKTNCANDQFKIRKMSSEIISDSITTILTDIVNSSSFIGAFPVSEKYDVVKPLLKAGKDRDELSSYGPLYNTSFQPKVL